ncbi:hypothetical protein [Methyloglobulus sp.]|uniref:hypothetical protein n=1 Tax=Methyloglobulus sp. TaxID=2518622 RepID=UPI003989850E
MPPGTSGPGKLAAASVIHRYISDLECPNSLPSIPKEAFPTLYKITARAFFAANEPLARRSLPQRLQFNITIPTTVSG